MGRAGFREEERIKGLAGVYGMGVEVRTAEGETTSQVPQKLQGNGQRVEEKEGIRGLSLKILV